MSNTTPFLDSLEKHLLQRTTKEPNNQAPSFYRYIGIPTTNQTYRSELHLIEKRCLESNISYLRFAEGVPKTFSQPQLIEAKKVWETFETSQKVDLHLPQPSIISLKDIEESFLHTLQLYKENNRHANPTMQKNFGIKLLIWIIAHGTGLFETAGSSPLTLFYGPIKEHEVYFLVFLYSLGADILYINPVEDGNFTPLNHLGKEFVHLIESKTRGVEISPFPICKELLQSEEITILQKPKPATPEVRPTQTVRERVGSQPIDEPVQNEVKQTKSYEELAKLASSVVMIKAYSSDMIVMWGGSGVIIDNNGLIITNYHVLEEAHSFGIVFEGQKNEYLVRRIVGRHPHCDLGLLKIDEKTTPVPIAKGDNLRRGQQVVAIGSPLGLMNTVSDGIVSGFRTVDRMGNMIQFTAPISQGSSGGGVFNMAGELVGISTAVSGSGQNINLATPSFEVMKLVEDYNKG